MFEWPIWDSNLEGTLNSQAALPPIRNNKLFKCTECDYSNIINDYVLTHMLTVHDKPYKCSICDFTTKEKTKLLKHIEAHDNPYKCCDCDYKNVDQDNVFEHIKEKHQGKNPYRCGKCDFTASNGDSVLKHIDENHKENSGAFSRFFSLNSMIFDI